MQGMMGSMWVWMIVGILLTIFLIAGIEAASKVSTRCSQLGGMPLSGATCADLTR